MNPVSLPAQLAPCFLYYNNQNIIPESRPGCSAERLARAAKYPPALAMHGICFMSINSTLTINSSIITQNQNLPQVVKQSSIIVPLSRQSGRQKEYAMGSLQFGGSRYDLRSRLLSCRALTPKENHKQKRVIRVFMLGVI